MKDKLYKRYMKILIDEQQNETFSAQEIRTKSWRTKGNGWVFGKTKLLMLPGGNCMFHIRLCIKHLLPISESICAIFVLNGHISDSNPQEDHTVLLLYGRNGRTLFCWTESKVHNPDFTQPCEDILMEQHLLEASNPFTYLIYTYRYCYLITYTYFTVILNIYHNHLNTTCK